MVMGLDCWRSEVKYNASDILLNNIFILIRSVCLSYCQLVRSILSTEYKYNTVDTVINDPAINDLLSPTTFFSCMEHFSIVNDL